jgi:REP element-mobilizing transposase RayT
MTWLSMLAETCTRFNFSVYAYCQMTNHYHMLLETLSSGLSAGMRYLNGNYSQYFNRKHDLVGHVFQGRYKAILCQREGYLLELVRYIELNPVRAGLVALPADWYWSSFRATTGIAAVPAWLDSNLVLRHFGSDLQGSQNAYQQFVLQGIHGVSPLRQTKSQFILGDEAFRAEVVGTQITGDIFEIRRNQRRIVTRPLPAYFAQYKDPKEAMAQAYLSLGYSMPEIALFSRVSVKTVSRAVHTFVNKNLKH